MNIYIYGGVSFRNEIHKILDHGNIRFKINDGEVVDINSLFTLEELIENDPTQIFLIDQNKIIEDDFISKYLKILLPKDAISKDFLDENGIGDISLRSYRDLLIYIEKRLESIENLKPKANEITSIDDMLEDDTLEALDLSLYSEVRS
ncbi:MAG: hypothetical protein DRG78_03055 [Epsilonproteobacteria bacterium]|nr:MAG: hypothetical protein DRG78_03055 [Campylobacterota bacterium]